MFNNKRGFVEDEAGGRLRNWGESVAGGHFCSIWVLGYFEQESDS